MSEDKRLIPEAILRHKGPDARKRLLERYFDRYRKSILIAYAWWLMFCLFGAHRIYLGQYKAAAVVFGISAALALGIYVGMNQLLLALSESDGEGVMIVALLSVMSPIPFLVIYFIEGVLLFLSVGFANDKIRDVLKTEMEATPYIPLSQ